jgi:glucan phosphoethanolaminetransferase (alkaline phosphatase superfamily)
MSDLDDKIHKALMDITDADVQISNESSIYEDIMDTFSGQYRNIMMLTGMKWLAAMLLWLFCIYKFFQQEEIMPMIAYASGAMMCSVVLAAITVFFWQEVNKNIFNREIKRLELQIALLIKHIKSIG